MTSVRIAGLSLIRKCTMSPVGRRATQAVLYHSGVQQVVTPRTTSTLSTPTARRSGFLPCRWGTWSATLHLKLFEISGRCASVSLTRVSSRSIGGTHLRNTWPSCACSWRPSCVCFAVQVPRTRGVGQVSVAFYWPCSGSRWQVLATTAVTTV